MKKAILILLLLSGLMAGCGAVKGLEASVNRRQLDKLKVGMTTNQVRRAMGKPYKSEFYGPKQIWFYFTDWQSDGKTTMDEMTPLIFENEILLGWGHSFLSGDVRRYRSRRRQQPEGYTYPMGLGAWTKAGLSGL